MSSQAFRGWRDREPDPELDDTDSSDSSDDDSHSEATKFPLVPEYHSLRESCPNTIVETELRNLVKAIDIGAAPRNESKAHHATSVEAAKTIRATVEDVRRGGDEGGPTSRLEHDHILENTTQVDTSKDELAPGETTLTPFQVVDMKLNVKEEDASLALCSTSQTTDIKPTPQNKPVSPEPRTAGMSRRASFELKDPPTPDTPNAIPSPYSPFQPFSRGLKRNISELDLSRLSPCKPFTGHRSEEELQDTMNRSHPHENDDMGGEPDSLLRESGDMVKHNDGMEADDEPEDIENFELDHELVLLMEDVSAVPESPNIRPKSSISPGTPTPSLNSKRKQRNQLLGGESTLTTMRRERQPAPAIADQQPITAEEQDQHESRWIGDCDLSWSNVLSIAAVLDPPDSSGITQNVDEDFGDDWEPIDREGAIGQRLPDSKKPQQGSEATPIDPDHDVSDPVFQRGMLSSALISVVASLDFIRGPIRTTSHGNLVAEETGDWVLLDPVAVSMEIPPVQGKKKRVKKPDPKNERVPPNTSIPEMKNGATEREAPRKRKPIARVVYNYITGSNVLPPEVTKKVAEKGRQGTALSGEEAFNIIRNDVKEKFGITLHPSRTLPSSSHVSADGKSMTEKENRRELAMKKADEKIMRGIEKEYPEIDVPKDKSEWTVQAVKRIRERAIQLGVWDELMENPPRGVRKGRSG